MTKRELRAALAAIAWQEHVARYGAERKSMAARVGQQQRWERMVDPDGRLPPRERARRAHAAQSAHMQRMTLQRRIEAQQRRETRERMRQR